MFIVIYSYEFIFAGIYSKRKELIPTVNKICSEYLNGILERKKERKYK
jgi:hypothetical protein